MSNKNTIAPCPNTHLVTFAREEPSPAQPSCGSRLYHLITMTFTPCLSELYYCLPQRTREGQRRKRGKSNKRPQMGVGQHSWQTQKQSFSHTISAEEDSGDLTLAHRCPTLWPYENFLWVYYKGSCVPTVSEHPNALHTRHRLKIISRLQCSAKPQRQQSLRKQSF